MSRHIRLVAAFDHRHIFLDPHGDVGASFAERERLFALPRSSWDDYNRKQEFEHDLINRKTTWSLTTQGILFAAYGVTFSAKSSARWV